MGRLAGKVALVTGGARGMGASHVRALVAEGARIVVGDVLEAEGKALEHELGSSCRFVVHDVTEFGGLDILVNNAGILRFQPMTEMAPQEFRNVIEVNLVSQFLGLRSVADVLRPGGSIVNVSSVNGLVGGVGLTAYSASKSGIRGLTRSAALELAPRGVRVNSIHPGGVATPMVGRDDAGDVRAEENGLMSRLPIPRYARADEVSRMVLFLASDDSSYCTGGEFVVDGGMTAGVGY